MKNLIILLALVFSSVQAVDIGDAAPKLIGRQPWDNKIFFLGSQADKPKVINFFWIECIPCKKELPELA